MTTYRIEPGDWECATGESVDQDVLVRKVQGGEITVSLLMDLGFEETEGKSDLWEIEAEWGYLQVWMWEGGPEWFVAGESLGDDGPEDEDDLRQFMRILGFKNSTDNACDSVDRTFLVRETVDNDKDPRLVCLFLLFFVAAWSAAMYFFGNWEPVPPSKANFLIDIMP